MSWEIQPHSWTAKWSFEAGRATNCGQSRLGCSFGGFPVTNCEVLRVVNNVSDKQVSVPFEITIQGLCEKNNDGK